MSLDQELAELHAVKAPLGKRLIAFFKEQINMIVMTESVSLAFPVEGRVKEFSSIIEKAKRKGIKVEDVEDFDDFLGVRVVTLYRKDINVLDQRIKSTFQVVSTNEKVDYEDNTFGYASNHYIIRLPEGWKGVPSISDIHQMRIEVQVRTLAQHMWAAVSHQLQYKVENTVPYELRRAINRASAVLELVDIEFDRLLSERDSYRLGIEESMSADLDLNVDLVKAAMDKHLPVESTVGEESYDIITAELQELGVTKLPDLIDIIVKNINKALIEDKKYFDNDSGLTDSRLIERGRYFSHTGLMREIMRGAFGQERANEVIRKRIAG